MTAAAAQFRAFIERIERLEEERKTIADDIANVYAELKGSGFDKDAAKTVIKIRRVGIEAYQEKSTMVDLYLSALGMIGEPEAPVRAPARTREKIEEIPPHDLVTGEIIELHSSAATPATDEQTGASQTPAAPVAISNPPAPPSSLAEADKAGDVPPPASPADPIPDFVPAFLVPAEARQRVKLRPNCLRPDTCAGQGARHCHSCEKTAGQVNSSMVRPLTASAGAFSAEAR